MHRLFLTRFPIIFIVIAIAHCTLQTTIRRTTNGPIEGIVQNSSLGQSYYAFKGVRFAEAPITGIDPLTGQKVDRRFKVSFSSFLFLLLL